MLKQRVITGVAGGAFFLFLVYWGGYAFTALILVLATLAFFEWARLSQIHMLTGTGVLGLALLWVLLFNETGEKVFGILSVPQVIFLVVLGLMLLMILTRNKIHIEKIGHVLVGSLYLGFAFHYMLITRQLENGFLLFILILFSTWATDTAAYFVGKKFGKRKLCPELSPNKTIEGSLGGLLGAVLVALIFQAITGILTYPLVLALGLVIGVTGQVGDLIESAVKRHFDVKDSGHILPGHGGILDRFDSLIAIYAVLYILQFFHT
ncbi:MAG: phosphatidate cytidylyltransferase [Bacillaceae bacterium]|nr:phosphatidate cytidylyltransferase [Bacillaceae bacterium]